MPIPAPTQIWRGRPSSNVKRPYAERGVAIEDGHADLEFGDLAVEVPRHEALPQQLHAVHLRFDAASAVIAAPVSPKRPTEIFRRPQGFVSSDRSGGVRLPWFCGFAGRDDGDSVAADGAYDS